MKKILEEDFVLLNKRIKVLEKQIFDLGDDFNEAVTQSSETWHDNAPFDAVRDKQSILHFELTKLRTILRETVKIKPKVSKKIQIGSKVTLSGPETLRVLVGGHWIGRQHVDGYTLISSDSPVAISLQGRKVGDEISLPAGKRVVSGVDT